MWMNPDRYRATSINFIIGLRKMFQASAGSRRKSKDTSEHKMELAQPVVCGLHIFDSRFKHFFPLSPWSYSTYHEVTHAITPDQSPPFSAFVTLVIFIYTYMCVCCMSLKDICPTRGKHRCMAHMWWPLAPKNGGT